MDRVASIRPKVSIVIPTRNRKALLVETLASVRAQTSTDWEVVVVDDGSTDDTHLLMESVCAEEPRFRFFARQGDKGNANVCRNQGFQKSRGDYIIFLDSDDLLAPHCLEQRVRLMERNQDIDFAVYPGKLFYHQPGDSDDDFGGASGSGDIDRLLGMDWPVVTTGPIWRRTALEKLGRWDENLPSWQDVEFHFRALMAELTMTRRHTHDFYHRIGDHLTTSAMQKNSKEHFDRAIELFERFKVGLQEAHLLSYTRGHLLGGCYLFIAEKQIDCQQHRQAHQTWRKALRQGLVGDWVYCLGVAYLVCLRLGLQGVWPLRRVFYWWKWKYRLARGSAVF